MYLPFKMSFRMNTGSLVTKTCFGVDINTLPLVGVYDGVWAAILFKEHKSYTEIKNGTK